MARDSSLSPAAKAALAYWPQIELAATEGLTTADLWSLIRDAAEDIGLASPGVTVQGVSQLRGIAGSVQARSRQIAKLAGTKTLAGSLLTVAPWARERAERQASPLYHVRFQHTTRENGELTTQWRTSVFGGKLPGTIGDLRRLIDVDAEQIAKKYGVDHVGVDNLQIWEV